MLNLELLRYKSSSVTLGLLFADRAFLCYTLEDAHHDEKIPGQTRIPEGAYDIGFHFGGHFSRYRLKYPQLHPTDAHGMLHIKDVPGFQHILIHIGNFAKDTEGCVLVGSSPGEDRIFNSLMAYTILYPLVSAALLSNETVRIHIIDFDIPTTK